MPRGKRNTEVNVEEAEQTQEVGSAVEGETSVPKKYKFLPYIDKSSLPDYKVLVGGNEERGTPPVVRLAEPCLAIMMVDRNLFKVLAYFKSPRGVVRKLWKILRLNKKHPRDYSIMKQLRAAGIPGAVDTR